MFIGKIRNLEIFCLLIPQTLMHCLIYYNTKMRRYIFKKEKTTTKVDQKFLNLSLTERVQYAIENSNWLWTYPVIDFIIENFAIKNILEIGVAYGGHARHLMNKFKNLRYTGVDPYLPDYDPKDGFSRDVQRLFPEYSANQAFDNLHIEVRKSLEMFQERCILIRKKSDDFFASNSNLYDCIYIDGDHRELPVINDLRNSWKCLTPGGTLIGDDIEWIGVKKSVEKFCNEIQKDFFVIMSGKNSGHTFIIKK